MWLIARLLLARPLSLALTVGDGQGVPPVGPQAPAPDGTKPPARDLPEDVQSALVTTDTVSVAAPTNAGTVPAQPISLAAQPPADQPVAQSQVPAAADTSGQVAPEAVLASADVPPDAPVADPPTDPDPSLAVESPAPDPSMPAPLALTLQTILDALRPAPASAEQIDTAIAGLARLWNSGAATGKLTPGMVDILHGLKAAMATAIAAHLPAPPLANDKGAHASDKVRWLQRALYVADIFDGDFTVQDIGDHADMENYDVDGRFGSHTQADLATFQQRRGLTAGRYDAATRQALLACLRNDELPAATAAAPPAAQPAPTAKSKQPQFVPPTSYPADDPQQEQPTTSKPEPPTVASKPVTPAGKSSPAVTPPAKTAAEPAAPPSADLEQLKADVVKQKQQFDAAITQARSAELQAAAAAARPAKLARLTAAEGQQHKAEAVVTRMRADVKQLEDLVHTLPANHPQRRPAELELAADSVTLQRFLGQLEELSKRLAKAREQAELKATALKTRVATAEPDPAVTDTTT